MSLVVDQLPRAYHLLVPELAGMEFPVEVIADCANCPMAPVEGQDPDKPFKFTNPLRCCTYNPLLANFLVGRILRRGDLGTRQMLKRMENLDGVAPNGVGPDKAAARFYAKRSAREFGRFDHKCPYWVEGEYHCSIWADRNAICRTWHCKHVDGVRGHRVWMSFKELLELIEKGLGQLCIDRGQPPAKDAPRDEFIAWYLWCASFVDSLGPADVERLMTGELNTRVIQVRAHFAERDNPMPDILVPTISQWDREDAFVRMTAYSAFDTHDVPRWTFVLFSKMVDGRHWREALALAEVDVGQPIGEDFVRFLWNHGLVSIRPDHEFKPGMWVKTRIPTDGGHVPDAPDMPDGG
jgi:hypothetical protein